MGDLSREVASGVHEANYGDSSQPGKTNLEIDGEKRLVDSCLPPLLGDIVISGKTRVLR
jgi:hypothetical protein